MQNMKKMIIALLFTLLNISTQAQNSTKICSIGFVSSDSVEIVFNPSTYPNVSRYDLYYKPNSPSSWQLIDSVMKDSLTVFYKQIINPSDSNLFRIFTIDTNNIVIDSTIEKTYTHLLPASIVNPGYAEFEFYIAHDDNTISTFDVRGIDSLTGIDTIFTNTGCCNILTHYGIPCYFSTGFNGNNITFYVQSNLINPCIPSNRLSSAQNTRSNFRTVYVPSTVGLNENINKNIQIHPNPSKDNIKISNIEPGSFLNVCDLFGKVMFSEKIVDNNLEINNLPVGFYTLKIQSKNSVIVKKIQIIM